jgi:NAD-dependent SIR2 family protein deacetylase
MNIKVNNQKEEMLTLQKFIACATIFVHLTCSASNFLLQKPTIITQAEVDQLPRYWSATFNIQYNGYKFLYLNGQVGIQLTDAANELMYQSSLWQELSTKINVLMPSEKHNEYYVDTIRSISHDATHQPQMMDVQTAAEFIKNNQIIFYTGAGISLASNVNAMAGLMELLNLNPQNSIDHYAHYLSEHESEILCNFADFCNRAFTAKPTIAHKALTDIALSQQTQIMTENFDFLHQRSGILPYCIDANSLRKNVSSQELQSIDAVICIGLSHDDRGFLSWYKKHNPQGIIIAFDIGMPDYLDDEDFLVKGDAQQTISCLRDHLLEMFPKESIL